MNYLHTRNHHVLFRECDLSGYVHPSNYFKWFEDARFCIAKEIGISNYFADSDIYFPVITSDCDFLKRIKADSVIEMKTTLAILGQAKLKFSHFIYDHQSAELLVKGITQVAIVSKEAGVLKRLDDALVAHIVCYTDGYEDMCV